MPLDKSNSFGLLVGVGKREKDADPMSITAKDAEYLQKTLSATNILAAENTTLLVNENATSATILAALDKLAAVTQQKPADLVVVYFSGHGYREEDDYYMICSDTTTENIATRAIPGNLFAKKLAAIQCRRMLVLLDCCHSAGMTDKDIPFDAKDFLEAKNKNRVIITACKKERLSYLSSPVSLFTYALIEGLSGKLLTDEAREVNVLNLAMDVRERVVALSGTALKLPQPQQPQLNVLPESETTNFTICFYPNGRPAKIPLLEQELAGLQDENGKEINLAVKSEPEPGYRNQFNWMMVNSTIQNSGDGSVNLKDSNGNTINITNGISEEKIVGILQTMFNAMYANTETINALFRGMLSRLDQNGAGESKILSDTLRKAAKMVTSIDEAQPEDSILSARIKMSKDQVKNLTIRIIDIEKSLSLDNRVMLQIKQSKMATAQKTLTNELISLKALSGVVFLQAKQGSIYQLRQRTDRLLNEMFRLNETAAAEDRTGDEDFEEQQKFINDRVLRLTQLQEAINQLS